MFARNRQSQRLRLEALEDRTVLDPTFTSLLGQQDYADGASINSNSVWLNAQSGEPAPFRNIHTAPVSIQWTHSNLPFAGPARLSFSLWDLDNGFAGQQLTSFTLNGIAQPVDVFEIPVGSEVNKVYEFQISEHLLIGGSLTVALTISSPPAGNEVGVDFARLVITRQQDIHMQSAQLQSGNTVQFTYETTGNPGPFEVGLYRSTDGITFNPADLIATQAVTASPTNPQTPGTFTLPGPFFGSMTYPFLLVVADPSNAIVESSEDNNSASLTSDIEAISLTWDEARKGVELAYKMKNVPFAPANSPNRPELVLYWSGSESITDRIGSPIRPVVPLVTTDGTYTNFIAASRFGLPPAGATHLIAALDRNNSVAEGDEGNNLIAWKHNLAGEAWFTAYGSMQGQYPGSNSLDDLEDGFEAKVRAFLSALSAGGVPDPRISSTQRSYARQFLMYYSSQIARGHLLPSEAQALTPADIDIQWDYGNDHLSVHAARQMIGSQGFAIGTNPVAAPSNVSRHISGEAIDMTLRGWHGKLVTTGQIATPWSLNNNIQPGTAVRIRSDDILYEIGRTFGVIKNLNDPPHWSVDGH